MTIRYIINKGSYEFNRQEMINFLVDTIEENELSNKLGNILPQYSIRKNCSHHPVRITREIGFEVEVIH